MDNSSYVIMVAVKKGARLLIYALLAHTYLWGMSGYGGVRPSQVAAATLPTVSGLSFYILIDTRWLYLGR